VGRGVLSGVLPGDKIGVYMGIFDFFIVIPQIVASLVLGGVSLAIAALLTLRVRVPALPPVTKAT